MPAAIVLFGDVIRSRRDAPSATGWLRTLRSDLAKAYPPAERLAPFEFTQGDEIQGLLAPGADPMRAVLRAALLPGRIEMRWVIVAGEVDSGEGPATQRTGPAFVAARERLVAAAARRERLAVQTGDAAVDWILEAIAPLFGDLLAELTVRQREIGWPLLVERLRRAEVADRLHVTRATISVAADRAHLRALADVADAIRRLVLEARPDRATMTA